MAQRERQSDTGKELKVGLGEGTFDTVAQGNKSQRRYRRFVTLHIIAHVTRSVFDRAFT